jgi:hypothetical protein
MRRGLGPVIAALALLAVSAQAVSADALLADGDGLSPIAGSRMNLGTICHGETATATALVTVRATGHPNGRNVFDNGATVHTSATVLAGTGLATGSAAPVLVMAADWRSQPNQSQSGAAPWDVSVTPDAIGRYRGRIEFRAEGMNRRGELISRVGRMNVVARVVDCTAPVFVGLPADQLVEATASDGADVAYVPPTSIDAVDGAVPVDCDVAASIRLPLGPTTVTCIATDSAGNVASGAFAITVADTTAPTLDGFPPMVSSTDAGPDGAVVDWALPAATDIVDGTVPVTCDPAPGSRLPVGTTTVTCSAADAAGNRAVATFTVDVVGSPPDPPVGDPGSQPPSAEEPSEPANPVESIREDTAAGGPVPAGAESGTPTPTQASESVLPDTRMLPAGRLHTPLFGLVLVGLAASLGARRRARR